MSSEDFKSGASQDELDEHAADLAARNTDEILNIEAASVSDDYANSVILDVILEVYKKSLEQEAAARTLASLFETYNIQASGSVDPELVDFLQRLGYEDAEAIQSLCETTKSLVFLQRGETSQATLSDVIKVARFSEAAILINEATKVTVPYFKSVGVRNEQLESWIAFGSDSQKRLLRQTARKLRGLPNLERRLMKQSELEDLDIEYIISKTFEETEKLNQQIAAIDEGDEKVIKEVWKRLAKNPEIRQIMGRLAQKEELVIDPIEREDSSTS
jgi:hypothetical protein